MSEATVTDISGLLKAPFKDASGTCEIHGDYTTQVLVIGGVPREPECMECLQKKIRDERQAESTRIASESEGKLRASRLAGIGLPKRMAGKRWSDYKPGNAGAAVNLKACQEFAANWSETARVGANLIMTGATGNGKTHLASVLCKQVAVENNVRPLYTTVSGMMRYIRATYSGNCEYSELDALTRFGGADLLVIDEVGVKLSSEHERSSLFEVIDMRYQDELPTVVISNLSIAEIKQHIDERLVDRLSENGTLLVFDWESHRGQS